MDHDNGHLEFINYKDQTKVYTYYKRFRVNIVVSKRNQNVYIFNNIHEVRPLNGICGIWHYFYGSLTEL